MCPALPRSAMAKARKHALLVVQCFPPLLKNAGGVAKRYLSLCRALIDGLGWQVSLLTEVDVCRSNEPEVERWLQDGSLKHIRARGVRITSKTDGVAVFLDLLSGTTAGQLIWELCWRRGYDAVFTDDVPWRLELLLLTRGMGVPAVVTTHTDITHLRSFKGYVKLAWHLHMLSTRVAAVHAATSRVFGERMRQLYGVPVGSIWPPCLWSPEFRAEPDAFTRDALSQRRAWIELLRSQGCEPKAIMLNAGRWAAEKRIHLLLDAVPADCALVIVGDGTSEYADMVARAGQESGRKNVLPLRKMLNARELRTAYAASDLFLTASDFETLGFTVLESWCSETPVAIQPAQGHLEFVKDGVNSWFVNYDDQPAARATLERIVASGLDLASLHKAIPEFLPMGARFRGSNYARDLDEAVIGPALAQGAAMRAGGLPELAKRLCSLVACALLWVALRIFTRIAFMTSRDPLCETLRMLGGATDDPGQETVCTLPWVRLLRHTWAFFRPSRCEKALRDPVDRTQ